MITTGPEAFFGHMGVTFALVFANLGAAYGTMKSGVGIASIGVLKPEIIMKSIIPVVKALYKGYGRYSWNLRHDRRGHSHPEK